MAENKPAKRKVESHQHKDKKRLNNPPVGLVTPETDPEPVRKTYEYDPHLDPQLIWAGKASATARGLSLVASQFSNLRIYGLDAIEG